MYQEITLAVRALVGFVLRRGHIDTRFVSNERMVDGGEIHRMIQRTSSTDYQAEVFLRASYSVDGLAFHVQGRADGMYREGHTMVIDEIKSTKLSREEIMGQDDEAHWGQVIAYAALYCEDHACEEIIVQLTYFQIKEEEIFRKRRTYTPQEVQQLLLGYLQAYVPWAKFSMDWKQKRTEDLQAMHFPYAYRKGQYELAASVYRSIRDRKQQFISAPTGIGKTISTLFPAMKAMGEGHGELIFYLTAKNVTRQQAQDTILSLRATMPNASFKSIQLTAKDKVCFLPKRTCNPVDCPYAKDYFERINDIILTIIQEEDTFTSETIAQYAKQYTVCPFELALDLTLFCDAIVCDYNYVYDPVAQLQRFFVDGGDYILLVDEAHNLVDRSRSMYSANLSRQRFLDVVATCGKRYKRLQRVSKEVSDALTWTAEQEEITSWVEARSPYGIAKPLKQWIRVCEPWLEKQQKNKHYESIIQLYFDIRFFLRMLDVYEDQYVTHYQIANDHEVNLLCLDASKFIKAAVAKARNAIYFSATLEPMPYFIQTLGGNKNSLQQSVASPFSLSHLGLYVMSHISTKYTDRMGSLAEVVDVIATTIQAKTGNYFVFASSYQYMEQIGVALQAQCEDTILLMQTPNMDERERANFLAAFDTSHNQSVVGLCVLGGVFSEGIDLVGERLIGTIVVGVGLPQFNPQQEALKHYYETRLQEGFAYAYQYPGMNKVLQAAGRVIRSETDRGVVILIDDRFASRRYRELFPQHYHKRKTLYRVSQLEHELKMFWKKED
ncbi:MAG: ATP-dependent DNA helicase [Erysipelotrichaceae bacterium]